MFCTLIDIEVVQQAASEGTLWQHTLDSMANYLVNTVLAGAELGGSVEALATGIAGVAGIDLVGLFLARETHLVGVDDDYVVTAIYMRSEGWLVLSAKQLGYLRAETTYNLVGSIHYDPLFLSCFLVDGNSLVT